MPFFVGSTHFNVQSFGETHFFMISNQGFSFILTFQSFNIKFEPKAEKILFLVSKSQSINDCLAFDENSNASKVKSKTSLHLVSILSLFSFIISKAQSLNSETISNSLNISNICFSNSFQLITFWVHLKSLFFLVQR